MIYGSRLYFYKMLCADQKSSWWRTNLNSCDWFDSSGQATNDCWDDSCAVKCQEWRCRFGLACPLVSIPERRFKIFCRAAENLPIRSWLLGHDSLQKCASTSQLHIQRFTDSLVCQTKIGGTGGWSPWFWRAAVPLVSIMCIFLYHLWVFNFFLPPVYNHS